jgi:hypothetical protein
VSTAHPILGYPSKTAAVADLLAKGHSVREVAGRLGIEEKSVVALDISGRRRKRPAETNGRTVVVAIDTLNRLHPHALRRRISVNELVRRIIDTAIDEQLIDNILDDGVTG